MKNSRIGFAILLFVMTAMAYSNSLFSDFVGDDIGRILSKENHYRQGFSAVSRYILADRPFLTLTLWLNYFFGGMSTFGFKLVNVLLHAGCAMVVFELMREIFKNLKNPERLAFFVAALFAVHPINNQAVLSVVQRGVILATVFSLLSYLLLLRHVRLERRRDLFYACILFLLALLSKPNVVVFPVLFILLLVKFEGLTLRRALAKCAPFFLLLLIPLVQYIYLTRSQANALPALQYFLVQTKVIFFYFSKYFYPVNLQFLYPIDNFPADLLAFREYHFLLGHLVILVASLWAALRRQSVAGWMIILGYLAFIPESGFFSILHVAFDHRNYIPLIFFSGAFVLVMSRVKTYAMVLAPSIVALGALNFNYTARIDTYDKWVFYNLEANPQNRSFYIYQLTQSIESGGREKTEKILALLGETAGQDREVVWLKSFADYGIMKEAEKKDFVQRAMNFALENQVSVHYFYFFEDFLRRELSLLYSRELAVFALNSFYFGYLDYWQKYLSAPELYDRIRDNFILTVSLSAGKTMPLEKMIGVRSEIALHRFFAISLQNPVEFYEELLAGELAGRPETDTLKAWLRQ